MLAEFVASQTDRPLAFVRKRRLSGREVTTAGITGEVEGRPIVIVDDMISTGATIRAAVEAALAAGALPDVVVAASHGLFVGDVADQFPDLPLRHLLVTDSLPVQTSCPPPANVVSIAPTLAQTIDELRSKIRMF